MAEVLIPRRDVKTRITQAGLDAPSDDQIERWDSDGLLSDPSSKGVQTAYGYTEAEQERLLLIARIVTSLKSKRVRSSEIAFWLCLNGATDVPAELVRKHIEAAIRTFQRTWLRILNGLGRRNEGYLVEALSVAKKLGALLAKKIVLKVIPSIARSSLAREIIGTAIALILRTSAKPARYSEVAGDLRRATTVLRTDSEPPPGQVLQELFSVLSDFSQLFRLDSGNTMLVAIKGVASKPDDVFQIVESTRNALAGGSRFFPWMTNPSTLPFLGNEDREFLARYLVPLLCGAMASVRNDEHAKELDAEMRAGNFERAFAEWGQMKQLSDHVVEAISLKEPRNE